MNVRVLFKEGGYTEVRIRAFSDLDRVYQLSWVSKIEVL